MIHLLFYGACILALLLIFFWEKIFPRRIRAILSNVFDAFCLYHLLRIGFLRTPVTYDFIGLVVGLLNLLIFLCALRISCYLLYDLCYFFRDELEYRLYKVSDIDAENFQYLQYLLGDQACINNAKSEYLQCAVNPSGDCESCNHRQTAE
jgi:Family of unknown function (DUF6464)